MRPEAQSLDTSRSSSAEAPAQDPAAQKIPGYILTRLLGEGAFASV